MKVILGREGSGSDADYFSKAGKASDRGGKVETKTIVWGVWAYCEVLDAIVEEPGASQVTNREQRVSPVKAPYGLKL